MKPSRKWLVILFKKGYFSQKSKSYPWWREELGKNRTILAVGDTSHPYLYIFLCLSIILWWLMKTNNFLQRIFTCSLLIMIIVWYLLTIIWGLLSFSCKEDKLKKDKINLIFFQQNLLLCSNLHRWLVH